MNSWADQLSQSSLILTCCRTLAAIPVRHAFHLHACSELPGPGPHLSTVSRAQYGQDFVILVGAHSQQRLAPSLLILLLLNKVPDEVAHEPKIIVATVV